MGDVQVGDVPAGPVWSHACCLEDLALPYALPDQQMKPLLDAYATQLTRAVDAARSTRQLTRSLAN